MKQVTYIFTIMLTIAVVNIGLAPSTATAQVGKDSGLWNWTDPAPHHQSIIQISSGGGTGTGVVIAVDQNKPVKDGFEGYCLTAWHVVADDEDKGKIKVLFKNGRRAKGCRVVQKDVERDVALLWVWVPGDIEPAKLATSSTTGGDTLEFAGLGGGSELSDQLRTFKGTASTPSSKEKIFADVPLLPGDSGGPVFNQNQEVVGIISGGWFWWDGGVKTAGGSDIKATWPARASNVEPIQTLMAKLDEDSSKY